MPPSVPRRLTAALMKEVSSLEPAAAAAAAVFYHWTIAVVVAVTVVIFCWYSLVWELHPPLILEALPAAAAKF